MSGPAKTLSELFPDAGLEPAAAGSAVTGLTADSRAVEPGFVFAALAGAKTDGAHFVAAAIQAGAVAVLAEAALDASVPVVRAADARRELALAAARLHPRQPSVIAAVTGTSGKSSTVTFLRQIWAQAGHAAASLGTLGVTRPSGASYGSLTTPDPVSLHKTLDELASEGVTHLAMEASSHGLDQRRLDGVRLSAAGYGNLSRDHLDYHPTLHAYREAKLRLFRELAPASAGAVVWADGSDAFHFVLAARDRGLKLMTIGARGETLRLKSIAQDGLGQRLEIAHDGGLSHVSLPLAGAFQVENAMLAAGLAIATGVPRETALSAMERLEGVPGRLELVGQTRSGAAVFVDYAHKPGALASVLGALRPFAANRLIVVFGCGGDRDPGKRPMMGAIAVERSDVVIVTDDNPRSEDPAAIRAAILAAAPGAREIGDRRAAIETAIREAGSGDVVVVAGKGHETGQIVGDRTSPFSDHEVVAETLAKRGNAA